MHFQGSVEDSKLRYLIRDHIRDRFESRKKVMKAAAVFINDKYGEGTVRVEIADSYPNMGDILEKHPDILDIALQATRDIGIEPKVVPIRGGTDGARLTEKGLPTPNLFTGGMNYHSRYEYASVQGMEKSAQVILRILELYAEKG
jgi:tripeptide aminopeptidase